MYNITNVISDFCRGVDELLCKEIVRGLDDSYASENNIPKNDLICRASAVPILTTKGYVFSSSI